MRWKVAPERALLLGRPIGAGIVNVTDDSMWEGARSETAAGAVADGLRLAAGGFEMIDVGAVPARAGDPVLAEAEAAKLIPAIEGLRERLPDAVAISADTFNPGVARAAVAAGADVINDIGGGTDEMLEVAAEAACGLVLMHIEGTPRVNRKAPDYPDVVARLLEWFGGRIARAVELGVDEAAIAIDPGLDFDLSVDHDIEILRRLRELHALGRPLYVSLSRKDFIGAIAAGSWQHRWSADQRRNGTLAAVTLATAAGAQIHRLHDIEALDAIRVAAALSPVWDGASRK